MNHVFRKMGATILAVAVAAACGVFPVQASRTGDYTATRRQLPDLAYINCMYETDRDTYGIFGKGNRSGQMEVWETADAGTTWQRKNPVWLETLNKRMSGAVWFIRPEGDEQALAVVYAAQGNGGPRAYPVWIKGSAMEAAPANVQGDAANILQRAYHTPAGLLCIGSGGAAVVDPNTGEVIRTLSVSRNLQAGQTLVEGSACTFLDEDLTIRTVDLATGKTTKEIPVQATASGHSNAIAKGADSNRYHYCDRGGLYRVTQGNTERLMDAAGTVLRDLSVSNLFELSDGSFLFLGFENDGGDRNKNGNRVLYHIIR